MLRHIVVRFKIAVTFAFIGPWSHLSYSSLTSIDPLPWWLIRIMHLIIFLLLWGNDFVGVQILRMISFLLTFHRFWGWPDIVLVAKCIFDTLLLLFDMIWYPLWLICWRILFKHWNLSRLFTWNLGHVWLPDQRTFWRRNSTCLQFLVGSSSRYTTFEISLQYIWWRPVVPRTFASYHALLIVDHLLQPSFLFY